ncbi:hypothetical protein QFC22_005813 [Naganishia vaughanmartiniae]|uniref:Uncharacterized protein n=1 Tax=Naganishia vaughanmartiniae TaxID=1424756 RepID=A0ACC2WQE0_9TREE|nr:hypothetical protein QFC22_005813 [Naganishia vaughanmartiniae]
MLASTLSSVLVALSACSLASASPLNHLEARNNTGTSSSRKICVVPSQYAASNGTVDDSPAIVKAITECANGGLVQFPMGTDYFVQNPVVAVNLSGIRIEQFGNLHLPKDIAYVQNIVNSTEQTWAAAITWFILNGNNIEWVGTKNVTSGWIESYGQAWWDANNSTGLLARPHLFQMNANNVTITDYKARKPIAWNMRISGNNYTIKDTFLDASTTGGFPFNTDGFDVAATNVLIDGFTIFNGDDAVAIQSGAANVTVRRGMASGPGCHGMSIGSLGQNQGLFNKVTNITFDDITMVNALYGARFKSWIGGQGLAENVTWSNMRFSNVSYPIFSTSSYSNQGSAQTQIQAGAVTGRPNNSTVITKNFRWENISGSINSETPGDGSCVTDPCWYEQGLPTLDGTQGIIIECGSDTSCQNYQFKNIQLLPFNSKPATTICLNATVALNPKLGFECTNGTYLPAY